MRVRGVEFVTSDTLVTCVRVVTVEDFHWILKPVNMRIEIHWHHRLKTRHWGFWRSVRDDDLLVLGREETQQRIRH